MEALVFNKRLFSPGPIQTKYSIDLVFSHRSKEFQQLYAQTSSRLLELAEYKNVVMVQGSATSAIETVLGSVLNSNSKILILVNGEFARRAAQIASFYTKHITQVSSLELFIDDLKNKDFDFCFMVMFETSLSIYNNTLIVENICQRKGIHLIVDAVSAFPYYPIPRAKFFITTSSKQLGGLPAMGLIYYNSFDDIELFERSDYLNLKNYIDYAEKNQTPHTSLIPQIDSLNNALSNLDINSLRKKVERNAFVLTKGLENKVINERICPVVTFEAKEPSKLVCALGRAGISIYENFFYMKNCVQIGCFNYDDEEIYAYVNELLRKNQPW